MSTLPVFAVGCVALGPGGPDTLRRPSSGARRDAADPARDEPLCGSTGEREPSIDGQHGPATPRRPSSADLAADPARDEPLCGSTGEREPSIDGRHGPATRSSGRSSRQAERTPNETPVRGAGDGVHRWLAR